MVVARDIGVVVARDIGVVVARDIGVVVANNPNNSDTMISLITFIP